MFVVTAWHGGSYGLKVHFDDVYRFFKREWKTVLLELPNGRNAVCNIDKESFWNETCRELISLEIGKWFHEANLAPWPKGAPPKFDVEYLGDRRFRVASQWRHQKELFI